MLTKSKNYLLLIALILFALPASAQDTKEYNESFDIGTDGRVSIDTYKGTIDITTWDGDTVEIDAVIEDDNSKGLVEHTEVRIDRSGRTVRIETDYSEAKKVMKRTKLKGYSLPSVHYTVRMPRTTELTIEDYKSEIEIDGVDADVKVETYKGPIDIRNVAGELNVDNYKSDVRIRNLSGSLYAETYKGSYDVEFDEFLGDTSFDTYRGDIEVTLPEDAGFDLDADLGNKGDIDANFSTSNLKKNKKALQRRSLRRRPSPRVRHLPRQLQRPIHEPLGVCYIGFWLKKPTRNQKPETRNLRQGIFAAGLQ